MRTKNRWRLGAVLAGVIALAVAAPAFADITTSYFGTVGNASDPHAFPCKRNNVEGYCLVTSKDLNAAPINPGGPAENYYPMDTTLSFFSSDGLYWGIQGNAINEQTIQNAGFPGMGTNDHLWAPAVRPVKNTNGTWGYYLYTPDLTNAGDKLASKIFVSYSTDPLVGYGTTNIPNFTQGGVAKKVAQLNGTGYMSDPEVFTDLADRTSPDLSKDYLIWANGDYSTCGDISIAKMTNVGTINTATAQRITINGLSVLGTCGSSGHPYIEGASLYRSDWWKSAPQGGYPGPYVLVAAIKPSVVPPQCAVAGNTNNTNQVIGYATSTSVTGPYTFRGVLSCGSTTEWTNQGTIQEVKTEKGEWRLVLVHHDGLAAPGQTPRNRQMHSECLLTTGAGQFLTSPKSSEGAVSNPFNGAKGWCLSGKAGTIFALKSQQNNKYVVSKPDTQLAATSSAIGLWEQIGWAEGGGATYDDGLVARNPGDKYIQVNRNDGNKVVSRGATFGDWEQLQVSFISGNTVELKDNRGWWIRTDSTGKLYGTSTAPTTATQSSYRFTLEWLSP